MQGTIRVHDLDTNDLMKVTNAELLVLSNQALMTQGTKLQSPNSIDIGPLPACTTNPPGANGTGGVRCIYNVTYC